MHKKINYIIILFCTVLSCSNPQKENKSNSELKKSEEKIQKTEGVSLVVLGTTQDAGSPQLNCEKSCCSSLKKNLDPERMVVSLGLIDQLNQKKYLFESTPDMIRQLNFLHAHSQFGNESPDGVFLTHAHIGHYSGLMYFGKEGMDAKEIPVYTMPQMQNFLETNGPWDLMVKNKNIQLQPLENELTVQPTNNLRVTPFLVPHRDEYSETVGYKIVGPNKSAIFIPDIDKWEKWNKSIIDEIKAVNYAFIDATFFDNQELQNRDLSEIPHPFVSETMQLFSTLSIEEKRKIFFIHLNHTNPLLNDESEAIDEVEKKGFNIARLGDVFNL